MSCIACECYAKRITNIFRDDDLKFKYQELTGLAIKDDCFICDGCNQKLVDSFSFRLQCVEVYLKLNPGNPTEYPTDLETTLDGDEDNPKVEHEHEAQFVSIADEQSHEDEEEEYIVTLVGQEQDLENDKNLVFLEEVHEKVELRESSKKPVANRKSYTVEEKLKIIEFAEENNNRVAARMFHINESSIRCFRRQKETLLTMNPQKKTNRKAFPHWPQLENELKAFVLDYPTTQGTKPKLKDIREKAIEIAATHGISNFNGSNSYIFKFMIRNNLPSASPRPRKVKAGAKLAHKNRK